MTKSGNTTSEEEASWAEEKKRCAARWVWPKRDDATPSGVCDWKTWFERMFGQSLTDYAAEIKARGKG